MANLKQYEETVQLPVIRPNSRLICHSQVVLGSPSTGCSGVWICKMYMNPHQIQVRCPVIPASLIPGDSGRLRIIFHKTGITPRYLKRHFRWNLFQVLEPFDLPGWTLRKLQLKQPRVEPGIYIVWETEEAFVVDF